MPMTIVDTIAVCECCALMIASGDESGCRDHCGHVHPSADVPVGTVPVDREGDRPSWTWPCGACGTTQLAFTYRLWADVLERQHAHSWRSDVSAMWCAECDTNTDFCQQITPS